MPGPAVRNVGGPAASAVAIASVTAAITVATPAGQAREGISQTLDYSTEAQGADQLLIQGLDPWEASVEPVSLPPLRQRN